jgi:hypothetical protein
MFGAWSKRTCIDDTFVSGGRDVNSGVEMFLDVCVGN